MKKLLLPVMLVCSLTSAYAQEEMKTVWETKLEHKAEENELDEESGNIISSNEKEITLLDANTGKT